MKDGKTDKMLQESRRRRSMEKEELKQDDSGVMEAAMAAGHILLENGAEIARVEETMQRICQHFGVESENFFVLSNGIFATGSRNPDNSNGQYALGPIKSWRSISFRGKWQRDVTA